MSISKSRLGRGLGNLIAGGISNSSAISKPAPAKPAATKPAAAKKPAVPVKKPVKPAGKTKPATAAAKPVNKATAKPTVKPQAKPQVKANVKAAAKVPAKPQPKAQPKAPAAKPTPKPAPKPTSAASATGKPAATATSSAAPASASVSAARTNVSASTATSATSASTPIANAAVAARAAAAAHSASAGNIAQTISAANTASATAQPATQPATHAVSASVTAASAEGNNAAPSNAAASSAPSASSAAALSASQPASQPASSANIAGSPAPSAARATGAESTAQTSASPYREIAVSSIVPNPYQPRREIDAEHIAELANSIASEGLLQPIVVRPLEEGKSYELIAGERRWRAHQKLGLRTIAVRVMNASDSSSAVISLIENIQRQALNPIEESLGFASLMRDFDLTQEAVAERVGRARASIANSLRLLALEREIQGYVAKGILSVGHAKILLGLEEPAQRALLARRIIEGGLSVRETEDLVRRLKNDKHGVRHGGGGSVVSEADKTAIADLEKQLSSRLNTKVHLKHTPKKGRIVIEYYGNEDLQRILERTGLQL